MNVREVIEVLGRIDPDRTVYIPDITDCTLQPVAHVVMDLAHLNLPEGISIPDDCALIPARMMEDGEEEVEV